MNTATPVKEKYKIRGEVSVSENFFQPALKVLAVGLTLAASPDVNAFQNLNHSCKHVLTDTSSSSHSYILTLASQIKKCEVKAKEFNIDPPTDEVKQHAFNFLKMLNSQAITPTFINPSQDGGIIIEFNIGDLFSLVEIFNDTDVVYLTKSGKERKAWDLNHNNFQEFIFGQLSV